MLNKKYFVNISNGLNMSESEKLVQEIKNSLFPGPYSIIDTNNNSIIELEGEKTFKTIKDVKDKVEYLYISFILGNSDFLLKRENFFDKINLTGAVIISGSDIENNKPIMKWNKLGEKFQYIDELEYLPREITHKGNKYIFNKLFREYRLKEKE